MAKRQSVNSRGFSHQNPIPNACRIGNLVVSSVIVGTNPGTRDLPPAFAQQVANVFTHMRDIIEAAGGAVEDIIKVTFWVKDPATQRQPINEEWVKMFPDAASRPARHTQYLADEAKALVQCDFTAVLG